MQNNRWTRLVQEHPIWIIGIAVAGSAISTQTLISYQHEIVIAQKDATIENLKARIEDLEHGAAQSKRHELSDVRKAATENRFSNLTNEQLKLRALEIAGELRRLAKAWESNVDPLLAKHRAHVQDHKDRNKTEEYLLTKARLWKAYNEELDKHRAMYDTKYTIVCAVLRDELERRLPQGLRYKTSRPIMYRRPFEHKQIHEIAWDLETAADKLPL